MIMSSLVYTHLHRPLSFRHTGPWCSHWKSRWGFFPLFLFVCHSDSWKCLVPKCWCKFHDLGRANLQVCSLSKSSHSQSIPAFFSATLDFLIRTTAPPSVFCYRLFLDLNTQCSSFWPFLSFSKRIH